MSAALIKRFGQTVQIKRDKNPEVTVKGKRAPDVYDTFEVKASVQPLKPDEVIEESVGSERNTQGIKVYISQELKTVDTKARLKPDIIVYQGEEYEVRQVDKWVSNQMSLQHYRVFAFLKNKELKE